MKTDIRKKKIKFLSWQKLLIRKKKLFKYSKYSFHYANKDETKSFYNDHFKEPTIEKVVSEIANEVRGDIKASVPKIIESKLGGKDFQKCQGPKAFPSRAIKIPHLKLF